MMIKLPRIIAHRGASADAPENTLTAMRIAKDQGVEWVEFDVQFTADQQLVVFHDEELERTTNGVGLVADMTLTQLQRLDAGSWWSDEYVGEPIPSFLEMVVFLAAQGLKMNIELKPAEGKELLFAKKIMNILQEHWPDLLASPIVSSFSWGSLYALREQEGGYPVALLMHEWRPEWRQHAQALNAVAIHVNHELLTAQRVAEIVEAGFQLAAYTINELHRAKQLYDWGVNCLFSDNAGKLLQQLTKLGQG